MFIDLGRLDTLEAKAQAGTLRDGYEPVNNVLRGFKVIQRRAFAELEGDHPIGTIHDLRKTYGTWMADVVQLHRLQRLMGHADIKTTMTFYVDADDAYDERIRDATTVETDKQVTKSPRLRLVGATPSAA